MSHKSTMSFLQKLQKAENAKYRDKVSQERQEYRDFVRETYDLEKYCFKTYGTRLAELCACVKRCEDINFKANVAVIPWTNPKRVYKNPLHPDNPKDRAEVWITHSGTVAVQIITGPAHDHYYYGAEFGPGSKTVKYEGLDGSRWQPALHGRSKIEMQRALLELFKEHFPTVEQEFWNKVNTTIEQKQR